MSDTHVSEQVKPTPPITPAECREMLSNLKCPHSRGHGGHLLVCPDVPMQLALAFNRWASERGR